MWLVRATHSHMEGMHIAHTRHHFPHMFRTQWRFFMNQPNKISKHPLFNGLGIGSSKSAQHSDYTFYRLLCLTHTTPRKWLFLFYSNNKLFAFDSGMSTAVSWVCLHFGLRRNGLAYVDNQIECQVLHPNRATDSNCITIDSICLCHLAASDLSAGPIPLRKWARVICALLFGRVNIHIAARKWSCGALWIHC